VALGASEGEDLRADDGGGPMHLAEVRERELGVVLEADLMRAKRGAYNEIHGGSDSRMQQPWQAATHPVVGEK
jgi:hypothetical protein